MRVLIIDNYDSFTGNLCQLVGQVTGCLPDLVRNDSVTLADILSLSPDAIVISPGPGRPDRRVDFGVCADVIRHSSIPILGVCLGFQGIAEIFGSRIERAEYPLHGIGSAVSHDNSELFADIPSPLHAVRYHSLQVVIRNLSELEPIAYAEDGTLMGLRHRSRPIWGVQFHPESIGSEYGTTLMKNFLALAALHAKAPTSEVALSALDATSSCSATCLTPALDIAFEKLGTWLDPEDCFLASYATEDDAFWLDSSLVVAGLSRFSFMGKASVRRPSRLRYDAQDRRITLTGNDGSNTHHSTTLFDFLQGELDTNHGDASLPFDFVGGWVGCVGYEVKADLGEPVKHHATTPDGLFIFVDEFLAFDHASREIYVVCIGSANDNEPAQHRVSAKVKALREMDLLGAGADAGLDKGLDCSREVFYGLSKAAYMEKVEACKECIRDGESYEICQTMNATMQTDCDPLALHLRLRRSSPAPYAGYFRVGDVAVVCASPERFLKIDRSGIVESKPIKGTAARHSAPDIDRLERDRLRHSAKNQAENLMIVDLLRHDLSWVCEPGSVHVPALMDIESYQTVHQMVSTIRGQLRADAGVVDCLRHAFPGGSMTGAPKARTMDLLNDLEGEARGIYSGTFGYFSINGCADLNIVIRTAVFSEGRVHVGMGGAVTLLSDAEEEYAEAILKGDVVLNALRAVHASISED